MTVMTFDTLKAVRSLESQGMPRAQAEAVAEQIASARDIDFSDLATKTDLAAVETKIELAKRDLKIWFGTAMIAAVGVILAAIRYLPAPHP